MELETPPREALRTALSDEAELALFRNAMAGMT